MLSPYSTAKTYKTIGINLKAVPFGENDRLITILSPEYGLMRVIAAGARKYKSQLRGKSELFVVNELLIYKGKSMSRITQAETIESYPKLSKNLGKLTASQYFAELVLNLALDEYPQEEFYTLLIEHLHRLEQISNHAIDNSAIIFAHLAQGIFHFLAIAGIAPQVHKCLITQKQLKPSLSNGNWRVGFSFEGGVVSLNENNINNSSNSQDKINSSVTIHRKLRAIELILLQQLGEHNLPQVCELFDNDNLKLLDLAWIKLEILLRHYVQYQCGKELKSAKLIDTLSPLEF